MKLTKPPKQQQNKQNITNISWKCKAEEAHQLRSDEPSYSPFASMQDGKLSPEELEFQTILSPRVICIPIFSHLFSFVLYQKDVVNTKKFNLFISFQITIRHTRIDYDLNIMR